ncbi:M2 family metallopeptidase [Allosphingosinicella flava]|uniref:M2 family metallopeptidase n=1 Tax=Allosphingosinicella flava TaxID=2771430 RepID=A0A7T2GKZ8_9SPHN|nr:M2 family metallopeptidase [Sphingosinicella flava]QPQ55790.1 M2 family metallopeptidase [Sphingosinicella flava]
MKAAVSTLALATFLAFGAPAAAQQAAAQSAAPTVADADAFVARAEKELSGFSVISNRAQWVNNTYITDDTDALAAYFGTIGTEMSVKFANEAAKFNDVQGLSYDTKRKLDFLRGGLVLPAPTTPGAAAELNEIATRLNSTYGKGRGTLNGEVKTGNDLEELMGTVRDPEDLKEMWTSWHTNVGTPMRADYQRLVEIANQGAKELGFADTGAMWRSGYDMDPDAFAAMMDKLWGEVKPLYDDLHCYTRTKLNEKYGDAVQAKTGPIRADLLGNMWAQEWGNIYDIVAPKGAGDIGYDLTELLVSNNYDATKIVKTGEGFFSSLGFAPLPETFWQRSMITAPRDREVVCHASAWDVDNVDDLRIKMCTKVNATDFVTVHHELGHNYYQRAYNKQPYLYLNSANDGFHEAIGDTIALSVTPEYLTQIGLLNKSQVPSADKDIGLLLNQAMDKVAFLPFGLMVDKWRWGVFSGATSPANYNKSWNDLRLQYQGIVPPVERTEAQFDPGAKYHIPGNTPYARYFLARILQFQFYKAACDQAGWKGPLHRCSFYGNKEVGQKLNAMLEMGASRPWPEALQTFTGTKQMSGKAMLEYFRPLQGWLKQQNKGKQCGW